MKTKAKDPKKVAAGRKGGQLSPTNFKRNREGAKAAGQRSAWMKHSGKLEDYPPLLIRPDGGLTPLNDPEVPARKLPPLRKRLS